MFIQYRRAKLLDTTFYDELDRPIFRTETTKCAGLPITTQLRRINSTTNIEKGKVDEKSNGAREEWRSENLIATINWKWPSIKRSTVTFEGRTMPLAEFLEPGKGCMNNDGYFTMNGELFVWKSNRFNPRLFNARTREEVATYRRSEALGEHLSQSNCFVLVSPTVSEHRDKRVLDAVFVTYFVYKATRDFTFPCMLRWWFGIQHSDVSAMLRYPGRTDVIPARSWKSVEREPTEREEPVAAC
ncbi:hypothetical protein SCHPADRAFT_136014 [Schizopora paradoxa]|uniref:DUF6593 domain-containing protein n=1 Tax=Schizopora paradoxa TaxID=27342 RepID=A0A0H2S2I5_9AGAM|nr:hypothetical protein SCHPADRAFT_136014 [Schizopora paradoxa]